MNLDVPAVFVVIRSSDERTLALCRRLVVAQVGEDAVKVVRERPFAEAVRATFLCGLEAGRPWTLALDADVLLREHAIVRLLSLAAVAPPNTFVVQGRILDKTFGGTREGGPHLFRTKLLDEALSAIQNCRRDIRPESFVVRFMRKKGYPFQQHTDALGLHDYEQYYKDLYRKAFVHAHKFRGRADVLQSFWRRERERDPDFKVLQHGFNDGQRSRRAVKIDIREFPEQIDDLLREHQLTEKVELATDAYQPHLVDRMIEGHVVPPEFQVWESIKYDYRIQERPSIASRIMRAIRTRIPASVKRIIRRRPAAM